MPEVGKIVVTGNVMQPGVFPFLDPVETNTVKSAIGQAKGLAQYWASTGYIYRMDEKGPPRNRDSAAEDHGAEGAGRHPSGARCPLCSG